MLLKKPRHLGLALLACIIFALSVWWFEPVPQSTLTAYFSGKNIISLDRKVSVPLIEMDGLRLGHPFRQVDANITDERLLTQINNELLRRLEVMEVDVRHPDCPINLARYEESLRVSPDTSESTGTKHHVTIAINLFQSEGILPSLSLALLELIHHLKRTGHKIFVSVYENDSKDRTLPILGELGAALIALNIDGMTMRHSTLQRFGNIARITALANIRNEALYPLFDYTGDGVLLFINDVITCGSDLLELVHQQRLQNAHVAISTDWYATGIEKEGQNMIRFRDTWVLRGINGDMPYIYRGPGGFHVELPSGDYVADLFANQDDWLHDRWLDGRAVPVYSGWNGAVAFDAKIFTDLHMRFRPSGVSGWSGGDVSGALGRWGELIATPGYLESDCAASECKLFARDLWNLMHGHARLVVAPQSRTGYTKEEFNILVDQTPITVRAGPEGPEELIDWSMVTMPQKVACVPNLSRDGRDIEAFMWNANVHRQYKNPRINGWT